VLHNIQTRTFAPNVTKNSVCRYNQQMHTNTLTHVYAVVVFILKSFQLNARSNGYLKSLTQNFCAQTAN